MLGGNRSESGIIILYRASEQCYLILALYKHALLLKLQYYRLKRNTDLDIADVPLVVTSLDSSLCINRSERPALCRSTCCQAPDVMNKL